MKKIHVPIDNSDHSYAAIEVATAIAAKTGGACIGMHAYAGKMHDYRFKQMEYTLPEEYQDEAELIRQRRIHDSLITTGLQLISESYTDVMRFRCMQSGINFEARARDGRNFEEVLRDIEECQPDLVVMGALGTGAVRVSRLGSVAERVLRRSRHDILLVRKLKEPMEGDIVVCIDGSPQSFAALKSGIELGKMFGKKIEAVAVYDPYLHYAVFNGIVDVLSEKASKVFRFKEQEALHEEIIDTGLAKIYESHLRVAQATAEAEGVAMEITLLDGKAFDRIERFIADKQPWLVACGRIGVHSDAAMDMGSTTEHLIREASANVYVSSGSYVPPLDLRAQMSVNWTDEAEAEIQHVPAAMRGIGRTIVLRWATERGHSVITAGDVTAAIDEFMPTGKMMRAISKTAKVIRGAEQALLEEPALDETRALCRICGYAARVETPANCPVCGGGSEVFDKLDLVALQSAADGEGDASEVAFDGQKLGWTIDARRHLQELPAGYLRRRIKAVIEKQARTRRLAYITREFATSWIAPELAALDQAAGPHRAPLGTARHTGPQVDQHKRLHWTSEAESRIERLPAGFLRNLAVEQIERLATKLRAPLVTLLHVETGIAEARTRIEKSQEQTGAPTPAADGSYSQGLNEVNAAVVEHLGHRLLAPSGAADTK